jgi:hypothetical protein
MNGTVLIEFMMFVRPISIIWKKTTLQVSFKSGSPDEVLQYWQPLLIR